jgi:hypothetical protein
MKAMAQEVRDVMETGHELGSHDLNSLQADRTDYFAGSLYVFAKVMVLLEDSGILKIDAICIQKRKIMGNCIQLEIALGSGCRDSHL